MAKYSKLDDATRGYIAGIIDGEGCISRKVEHSGKTEATLTITNTHLPILHFCQKAIGGSIRQSHRTGRNIRLTRYTSTKPCYRLYVAAHDELENALEQVKDLLILKREKALWAIELASGRKREYIEMPWHLLDSRPKGT